MKKILSLLSLAALTVGLLGSCSKINERLDNLEKDVNGLKNEKIASIESQIAGITSSIADLGTIRSDISSLKQSAENHGIDIFNLEEADRALKDRIDNLEDYLDVTLPKFAEKEWVEATFSTLEQYEATCDTIAKIDARIGALDAKLSKDIKATADSLTKWVNKQFEGYYTAAEVDAIVEDLQAQIDTLPKGDSRVDSLAAELTATKAAIETTKEAIRTEYRAAITSAITQSEGKLTKALQEKISDVNGKIESLNTRVEKLETSVEDLKGKVDKLEEMIQSVTIVPAYSDGSVKVEDDTLFIDLSVTPKEAVATLGKDSVKILLNRVQTKAVALDTVPTDSIKFFKTYNENGIVSIKAHIKKFLAVLGDESLTVALNIKNGISDFTTDFVPVYVAAPTIVSVQLWKDGPYWAMVNLGEVEDHDPAYPAEYGALYNFADAVAEVAKLGDGWRLPTKDELSELLSKCTKNWETCKNSEGADINGYRFTGSGDYSSNSIFLPAAGYDRGDGREGEGSKGYYWSSTEMRADIVYRLNFHDGAASVDLCDSSFGLSVRAVRDAAKPLPAGALAGEFTVAEGKKVRFSKGNLVATIDVSGVPTAWKFAANQYDYLGAGGANKTIGSTAGDVDLFGWSTEAANNNWGIHTKTTSTAGYTDGNFKDWGTAIDSKGTWRTLSKDEWTYLFFTRKASTVSGTADARYAKATVNDIKGIILLPDTYTHPEGVTLLTSINTTGATFTANTYDLTNWTKIESAGAVFLPAAGYRFGSNIGNIGSAGSYWLFTANGSSEAYGVSFNINDVNTGSSEYRTCGFSVRLVTEVK